MRPASTPAPDMASARALLHGVRARLRRVHTTRGAALLVAVATGIAVVSFGMDVLLDLPVAVRAVHLIVVAIALLVFAKWAFGPLRTHSTDEQLAEAIEHDVPEFEDRLVSALDFEKRLADPAEPESKSMMAAAVTEASSIAKRIDATLLVDSRPSHRAMVLAGCGVAALVTASFAFPEEFAIWLRRGLFMEDISWPRRTTIHVLDFPAEGPLVVTRGDDLRVVALAEGSLPSDLDLHLEELTEEEEGVEPRIGFQDVRKMFPVADQPGRYAFDFRAVASSFRFWVTGGDDQDRRPEYTVRALVPPRVASFTARIEAPPYSGLPATTVLEPIFDALTGSVVTFSFKANMPLAGARLIPHGTGAVQDLALSAANREFSARFELKESVEFHLELKAVAGHVNRNEDDVFRVGATTDRAPTVRVLFPHGRIVATPQAVVPVKVLAEDDFGLSSLTLEARQSTSAAWTAPLWSAVAPPVAPVPAAPTAPAAPAATGPAAAATKSVHVYRPLDLTRFQGDSGIQVKAGDVLNLRVRAKDAGGLEGEGAEISVEVVSPEEMQQRISGEMSRLRDDLLQARRSQRKLVASLGELSQAAGAAADTAALRRGRDLQVDQGRVTNDAGRFLVGIERVFDSNVLDRLGSGPTVDRLMPIYHEFLALPPDDAGEVFPAALYAKILAEKAAGRLYDPEILGILLDVMEMTSRVRDVEGPAAYDAIERWAADGAHAPADLAAGGAGAAVVLSTLDAIDERLQKFEDLAAIIQLATSIHDGLNQLTKKSAPSEKK
ncbi:MAG: hypothetical protein K8T90_15730 [Planctomycetes bacterium]|nr:hypothetical protein [Planctomycetota bacterium]